MDVPSEIAKLKIQVAQLEAAVKALPEKIMEKLPPQEVVKAIGVVTPTEVGSTPEIQIPPPTAPPEAPPK